MKKKKEINYWMIGFWVFLIISLVSINMAQKIKSDLSEAKTDYSNLKINYNNLLIEKNGLECEYGEEVFCVDENVEEVFWCEDGTTNYCLDGEVFDDFMIGLDWASRMWLVYLSEDRNRLDLCDEFFGSINREILGFT